MLTPRNLWPKLLPAKWKFDVAHEAGGELRQRIISILWASGTLICLVFAVKAAMDANWVRAIHWTVGLAIAAWMTRKAIKAPETKNETEKE